jgi:hypothetical protein
METHIPENGLPVYIRNMSLGFVEEDPGIRVKVRDAARARGKVRSGPDAV